MYTSHLYLALLIGICFSCSSTKNAPYTVDIDETLLDTLTVSAPREVKDPPVSNIPYNEEAAKSFDIIHMDLSIEPRWEDETVKGEATITLKPYFYPIRDIKLDAKRMVIHSILSNNKNLPYIYANDILTIQLDRLLQRNETIELVINYTARPSLGQIPNQNYRTNDQGLYFIEPSFNFPTKPYQIWSQGETEHNSSWFPTRDKPNERFTHSIQITVADSLKTLSNGLLEKSEWQKDGKRTDFWIMDIPHAPYLTMVAIGDYAVIEDTWKNIPLQYYVYPEYEAYAKNIFNHTPEMLSFFSDLTGVPYPWQKYAQIVVEDFVAGAMENTTAVTFGEFVQKTDEQLIDNHNDDIVAHEMFHHWFGDYVTCESWANLTLNEGFANYSEYLWIAHKYGEDMAHNKRMQEWSSYILQSRRKGVHPLIHYGYLDKELMFDAHSYNKGGLTLHYLRHIIGDDAFFEGMQQYLEDNAGTSVEIDELRLAYEKVTGLDLKPFFDQWFLSAGHPDFEILYTYSEKSVNIEVKQIQSMTTSKPIFSMPLEWHIHMKDGSMREEIGFIDERKTNFTFLGLNPKEIAWINFDPHHVFIGEYLENRDSSQYIMEYENGDQYDKREALDILKNFSIPPSFYRTILKSESNYINKIIALYRFQPSDEDKLLIASLLQNTQHVQLTKELLKIYLKNPDLVDVPTLNMLMKTQQSMEVINRTMFLLYQHSPKDFDSYFQVYKTKHIPSFILMTQQIFTMDHNMKYGKELWNDIRFLDKRNLENVAGDLVNFTYFSTDDQMKQSIEYAAIFLKDPTVENWRKELVKSYLKESIRTSSEELQSKLNKWMKLYKIEEN